MEFDPKLISVISTIFTLGVGYGYVKFALKANTAALVTIKKHTGELLTFMNVFQERIKPDTIDRIWNEMDERGKVAERRATEIEQLQTAVSRLEKKIFNGNA